MESDRTKMVPLSKELNISDEEVLKTAKRMNFLITTMKADKVEEHKDEIMKDWETIASRLNVGGKLMDQENEPKRERDLNYLYRFLMIQLGVYDLFFSHAVSPEEYEKLKRKILNIIYAK